MIVILEMANTNNLKLICKLSKSFLVVLFIIAEILNPQNKQSSKHLLCWEWQMFGFGLGVHLRDCHANQFGSCDWSEKGQHSCKLYPFQLPHLCCVIMQVESPNPGMCPEIHTLEKLPKNTKKSNVTKCLQPCAPLKDKVVLWQNSPRLICILLTLGFN